MIANSNLKTLSYILGHWMADVKYRLRYLYIMVCLPYLQIQYTSTN